MVQLTIVHLTKGILPRALTCSLALCLCGFLGTCRTKVARMVSILESRWNWSVLGPGNTEQLRPRTSRVKPDSDGSIQCLFFVLFWGHACDAQSLLLALHPRITPDTTWESTCWQGWNRDCLHAKQAPFLLHYCCSSEQAASQVELGWVPVPARLLLTPELCLLRS